MNETICGDCLEIFPTLPRAKMVFADPPDNLGKKYDGFKDRIDSIEYIQWLDKVIRMVVYGRTKTDIFWLSYFHKYQPLIFEWSRFTNFSYRQFIWRFTFGQSRQKDCTNSYRPIMRWMKKDAVIYPDAIRVPSARLTKYKDKRANPKGKLPDDVWEFSRICGTFKERQPWHPTQHPEALMERIIKLSCKPGDQVIDLFAGSGTTQRVCKRLGVDCIGIEQSEAYCEKIREELCR